MSRHKILAGRANLLCSDLQDRNVAIWNRELLYVGGFLARAAYEFEMAHIKERWDNVSDRNNKTDPRRPLQERTTHALRFFTFHPSQPSTMISELLELAFFNCSEPKSLTILSTEGIQDSRRVRMPNPTFSFLETLAFTHPDIISGASQIIESLQKRGFLTEVTFKDVLEELRVGPLSESRMVECLKWRSQLNTEGMDEADTTLRHEFLDACSFVLDSARNTVHRLLTVKTFISSQGASRIIVDGPLPNHTLPYSISKRLPTERLPNLFGWSELSVVEWLSHVVAPEKPHASDFNITSSASWSVKVLERVAASLSGLSQADTDNVVAQLSGLACLPTNIGMVTPDKAYFVNIDLFQDLPIVVLPNKQAVRGDLEKLLERLGVRRHIDLQLLFERMIDGGVRNAYQLIKYLCSVQETLSEKEWKTLETAAVFSMEGVDSGRKMPRAGQRSVLFALKDLHEPLDTFRVMKLPLLQWDATHKWQPNSKEGTGYAPRLVICI